MDLPESQIKEKYDAFISYSTDPDYALSRRVESFLEAFHKLPTTAEVVLKPLEICRDGSDFALHNLRKQESSVASANQAITRILTEYLQNSTYLLVLCSANAANSAYVNFETNWFAEHKGQDKILLAVTEGDDPLTEKDKYFSKEILQRGIQNEIFYDFRGFNKNSKQWKKVRDVDEELTKLAAHLNNESVGRILPIWRAEETKKLRRQRFFGAFAAAFFLVLFVIAIVQWMNSVENEHMAKENLKRYELEQFQRNIRNGEVYLDAEVYNHACKEFREALLIAERYPEEAPILARKEQLEKSIVLCNTKQSHVSKRAQNTR